MEYVGQNHLKQAIRSIYNRGVAILIGPDKYGKTYFAQECAKEMNLEYVLVESNVEDTKALIQDIEPGHFYHMKDLHKARPQVLSRMLKLLEDNVPKGAVIFITTEQTKTIETILSRCLVLKCKRYSYEELQSIKDVDMLLYKVYDTPTKLSEVSNDMDKVIESITAFLDNPDMFKSNDLSNIDYKIVANVLITKLAEKKMYSTIRRVAQIAKGFERNDYIPNWQAVHMLLEDVRDDLI